MTPRVDIEAAGAVISRRKRGGVEILLIHRPKYDDWSFPKGKVDPDEHLVAAAVREVAEETGLDIRLSKPLTPQFYAVFPNGRERLKKVDYWSGQLLGGDDLRAFTPNSEVDEIAWFPADKARKKLTYPHDRKTLDDFLAYDRQTRPLVILRHSKARSRKSWRGDDRERPLTLLGEYQAEQLVPLLNAFGVTRLLSSSSTRCSATIAPYAEVAGLEVEGSRGLTEEDATEESVVHEVQRLIQENVPAVICSHRPVLPWVFAAAGVPAATLEPGAFLVVHHRRGRVIATEQHVPPTGR
jgi:8-oxo-dGTP diphosphatase